MRPIKVSVGPLANSSSNNIATSQTPIAGTSAVATMTSASASILATNAFVAGQAVQFLNQGGKLPAGFTGQNNYFVSATGLSVAHFQVSAVPGGTSITVGTGGAGTQNVVSTSSIALNGTLVNSLGIAVLDSPRRILITTNDTTTTFTIVGTDRKGNVISESFLVVAGSSYSSLDYSTVTAINLSQGTTAAVTVGTNGIASTAWAYMDEWANTQVMIQIDVSGSVNYTLQTTSDNPNTTGSDAPIAPGAMTWIATNDLSVVGATTSQQSNFMFTPLFARVLLNSGTGSLTAKFVQANVVNA